MTKPRHRRVDHATYLRTVALPLLAELGRVRKALCDAPIPLNTPDYRAAQEIVQAIDRFAMAVTGDPEHFWLKTLSTPERPD